MSCGWIIELACLGQVKLDGIDVVMGDRVEVVRYGGFGEWIDASCGGGWRIDLGQSWEEFPEG